MISIEEFDKEYKSLVIDYAEKKNRLFLINFPEKYQPTPLEFYSHICEKLFIDQKINLFDSSILEFKYWIYVFMNSRYLDMYNKFLAKKVIKSISYEEHLKYLDESIDSENKDLDFNLSDLSTIIDQNVKNINHRIVYKLSVYIPDIIAFSDEEYNLMVSNGNFRDRSKLEAYIEENRKRYKEEDKETYGLKQEDIAILANY